MLTYTQSQIGLEICVYPNLLFLLLSILYDDGMVSNNNAVKVIRKFFFTHTKVLDDISGITKKHDFFFPFEGLWEEEIDLCVFLRMSSGTGGRVGPGPMR